MGMTLQKSWIYKRAVRSKVCLAVGVWEVHLLRWLKVCVCFNFFIGSRGRRKGRENLKQAHAQHGAWHGAQHGARSHDPEIMTWAEIKSRMLNWLSPPGAPIFTLAGIYWASTVYFALFQNLELLHPTAWTYSPKEIEMGFPGRSGLRRQDGEWEWMLARD